MAAELEMVEGRASMMYAADSGVPWHGDGTPVPTAVNSREAAHAAGIDWTVGLRPVRLVLADGQTGPIIPDQYAITRESDDRVLGIGGRDYRTIQNHDGFAFLDSLWEDRVLTYDTAGSLYGGKVVWMLARLQKDMRILNDIWAQYLLAVLSHDGNHSAQIFATKVRVVCANTLARATRGKADFSIRHSGNIGEKLEAARKLMAATTTEHQRMEEWLRTLAATPVTDEQVEAVQTKIFGTLDEETPTIRRNAIQEFLAVYNEERDRTGQTGYTLANTVTGYADHKVRLQKSSSRFASVLTGRGAQVTETGLAAVAAVTGVKRA